MSLWQTPAIVVALLIWLNTPPASLADAARREALRRQLMPKATRVLTNEDVDRVPARPLPTAPPAAGVSSAVPTPAEPDAPKAPEAARDEAWWRDRMVAARETLARDRLLAEALQSRINALTADWSARDDPAQRQQLYEERIRTLAELEKMREKIAADEKAIADIEDEARRENVPPGWIRQ